MDLLVLIYSLMKDTTAGKVVTFLGSLFLLYCLFVAIFDTAGKYIFFALLLAPVLYLAYSLWFTKSDRRGRKNRRLLKANPGSKQICNYDLMDEPCVYKVVCKSGDSEDCYQGERFDVNFEMEDEGLIVSVTNKGEETITVYWHSVTVNGKKLGWNRDEKSNRSVISKGATRRRYLRMMDTDFAYTLMTEKVAEDRKLRNVNRHKDLHLCLNIGIAKETPEQYEFVLQILNLNENG